MLIWAILSLWLWFFSNYEWRLTFLLILVLKLLENAWAMRLGFGWGDLLIIMLFLPPQSRPALLLVRVSQWLGLAFWRRKRYLFRFVQGTLFRFPLRFLFWVVFWLVYCAVCRFLTLFGDFFYNAWESFLESIWKCVLWIFWFFMPGFLICKFA